MMHIHALHLCNFRLYKEAFFTFSPGINLLVGPNAQGKTTILEAIYFLLTGRSFRTHQLTDLIREGADFFAITLDFSKQDIPQRLQVVCDGERRKITHNHTTSHTATVLLGILHGVIMTPDDVMLIKGGPQLRRRYLDIQLAQVDPLYVQQLSRYQQAMRQRNALLKAKEVATIGVWEQQMAQSAEYIVQQRRALIDALTPPAEEIYSSLSLREERFSVAYTAKSGDTAFFRREYEKQRYREMKLGMTVTGPHKDDCKISLGGKELRIFGSEGEQRSGLATLRLAEWKRMEQETGFPPLMMVDDMAMSLDRSRQDRLLEHLRSLGQVFITTTSTHADFPSDHMIRLPVG